MLDKKSDKHQRRDRQPDKINMSDESFKKIAVLSASLGIPKYRIYGYAIEFAIRNWKNLENYIRTEEDMRKD